MAGGSGYASKPRPVLICPCFWAWPADGAMTMPQQLTRGWRVSSTSASSTVATSVS